MDKRAALDILDTYRDALETQGIAVDRFVLFGSYAHGTAHENSDIDLIVISQDFEDMDFWQRVEVLSRALVEVWEPIEAVAKTPAEWEAADSLLITFAKEGGEVVYSRE